MQGLRYRTTVSSRAHNNQPVARNKTGVDVDVEVEYVLDAVDGGGGGGAALRVTTSEFKLSVDGLGESVRADSRELDAPDAAARMRFPAALAGVRGAQRTYELDPSGELAGGVASRGAERALAAVPFPVPGQLPAGTLEGTATPGASWEFRAVLQTGPAGFRYPDPLVLTGSWRVTDWDPSSRTAHLVATGATAVDDSRLRTMRVQSCELSGEAVWDGELGLVTSSSIVIDTQFVSRESPSLELRWHLDLNQSVSHE